MNYELRHLQFVLGAQRGRESLLLFLKKSFHIKYRSTQLGNNVDYDYESLFGDVENERGASSLTILGICDGKNI